MANPEVRFSRDETQLFIMALESYNFKAGNLISVTYCSVGHALLALESFNCNDEGHLIATTRVGHLTAKTAV